jgi:hypothetical protein
VKVTVELVGVREMEGVLEGAGKAALPEGRKVVARGALNMKKGMRRRVQGIGHAPAYPSSITYDIETKGLTVEAEVGPDKARRQGALGNILNYGTLNNAPIPHVEPALADEQPKYYAALEALAAKLVDR